MSKHTDAFGRNRPSRHRGGRTELAFGAPPQKVGRRQRKWGVATESKAPPEEVGRRQRNLRKWGAARGSGGPPEVVGCRQRKWSATGGSGEPPEDTFSLSLALDHQT